MLHSTNGISHSFCYGMRHRAMQRLMPLAHCWRNVLFGCMPLEVLRYTLYPATVEVLAIQDSATECACCTVAVKFTPGTLAAFIVTLLLAGEYVYPVLLGVTVNVPFAKPEKL